MRREVAHRLRDAERVAGRRRDVPGRAGGGGSGGSGGRWKVGLVAACRQLAD